MNPAAPPFVYTPPVSRTSSTFDTSRDTQPQPTSCSAGSKQRLPSLKIHPRHPPTPTSDTFVITIDGFGFYTSYDFLAQHFGFFSDIQSFWFKPTEEEELLSSSISGLEGSETRTEIYSLPSARSSGLDLLLRFLRDPQTELARLTDPSLAPIADAFTSALIIADAYSCPTFTSLFLLSPSFPSDPFLQYALAALHSDEPAARRTSSLTLPYPLTRLQPALRDILSAHAPAYFNRLDALHARKAVVQDNLYDAWARTFSIWKDSLRMFASSCEPAWGTDGCDAYHKFGGGEMLLTARPGTILIDLDHAPINSQTVTRPGFGRMRREAARVGMEALKAGLDDFWAWERVERALEGVTECGRCKGRLKGVFAAAWGLYRGQWRPRGIEEIGGGR
ncbi:hypothetical protein IAT38_001549 [Cryptococcus sp. DSM 104549]